MTNRSGGENHICTSISCYKSRPWTFWPKKLSHFLTLVYLSFQKTLVKKSTHIRLSIVDRGLDFWHWRLTSSTQNVIVVSSGRFYLSIPQCLVKIHPSVLGLFLLNCQTLTPILTLTSSTQKRVRKSVFVAAKPTVFISSVFHEGLLI